ncbi:MAG: type 2 isopentenyl-diphosphate Delta-isomerase [Pseudomonadota bacterium]
MSDITKRKDEHLDIVLQRDVAPIWATTGFERMSFEHVALPELSLADIDLSTTFLGRAVSAPMMVSSMTGGPARAEAVNAAIADAARALGLAFGVGSQRVALETENLGGLGGNLRRRAGPVPILANLGAAQLREAGGLDHVCRAVDMIDADGIIIHLNPLQEAVQSGGDTDWRGVLNAIEALCAAQVRPVIAKEVGGGISARVAVQLRNAGVSVIDVAGAGGTSWAAVEAERATNETTRAIASAFRDWGIPTAQSIVDVREACPNIPIIASGGIRNGIDAAKAIRLGATLVGQAGGVLQSAVNGPKALIENLSISIEQLKVVCFCTGSASLSDLREARAVASDPRWLA